MFTHNEIRELIGHPANLKIESLHIPVNIIDTRQVFNRVDCLVQPIEGDGQQWVSVERLREPTESNDVDVLTHTALIVNG